MSDERYHKPDCESLTCFRCLPPVAVLNDPAYIALQAALAEKEGKLKIMTDDAGRWESAFQAETLARSNDNAAQAQEIKTLREERNYIDEKATQDYARHLCEIDNLKAELQRARELCIVRAAEREEVENGIAAKDRIISEQAAVIAKAVEVLDRGCTCHGYECHCDSSNVTDARSILESGPAPQPAQEKSCPECDGFGTVPIDQGHVGCPRGCGKPAPSNPVQGQEKL